MFPQKKIRYANFANGRHAIGKQEYTNQSNCENGYCRSSHEHPFHYSFLHFISPFILGNLVTVQRTNLSACL